jgi:hypothetical protein
MRGRTKTRLFAGFGLAWITVWVFALVFLDECADRGDAGLGGIRSHRNHRHGRHLALRIAQMPEQALCRIEQWPVLHDKRLAFTAKLYEGDPTEVVGSSNAGNRLSEVGLVDESDRDGALKGAEEDHSRPGTGQASGHRWAGDEHESPVQSDGLNPPTSTLVMCRASWLRPGRTHRVAQACSFS